MPRRTKSKRSKKSTKRRTSVTGRPRGGSSPFVPQWYGFVRTLTSLLPLSGNAKAFLGLVDLAFNWFSSSISTDVYYRGAYCMFTLTPAPLLRESPLLAKNKDGGFSFPGHPVKLQQLTLTIRNTVSAAEKAGQWAAVFVPFRESHDASHYKTVLSSLTFTEVAAMPMAKRGPSTRSLVIKYNFPDPVAYCAQPRELTEAIGFVYIIWETESRAIFTDAPLNSQFNCEIDATGRFRPYPIFGPQHRVDFDAKDFKITRVTDGLHTRHHNPDGTVVLRSNYPPSAQNELPAGKASPSLEDYVMA